MAQKTQKEKLEKDYKKYFRFERRPEEDEQKRLEQPHSGKIITTVTTYAAYEEPI